MNRGNVPTQGSSHSTASSKPLAATRIPLMSSSLGKRQATDAGLAEETAAARKALSTVKAREISLERKVMELERAGRIAAEHIEEQRIRIETLTNERRVLHDGETMEKAKGEDQERAWAEERAGFVSKINDLRRQMTSKVAELDERRHLHESLTSQHLTLQQYARTEVPLLEARILEVEAERDNLRVWKRRAESLSISLEEEKRKALEVTRAQDESVADRQGDEVVRRELRRQSQNLVSLQHSNDILQSELADLRRWRKEADSAERASKEVERGLRDEIKSLHEQLERARFEVDSLTQTFPESSTTTDDTLTLQHRLVTLSTIHAETELQLTAKNKLVETLHLRLSALAQDSENSLSVLARRAQEAERDLRWAKEGRHSAETREKLTRQELDLALAAEGGKRIRGSESELRSSGTEGFDKVEASDQSAHIAQLQSLVDSYKTELEGLSRDSRDIEARLTHGAGLVKRTELETSEAKVSQLESDAAALHDTIAQLTAANTTLDAEVSDLMRRVASGEYNPEQERCLELQGNPAAKIHAVRTQLLDDLRAENTALLERLSTVDRAPVPDGLASSSSPSRPGSLGLVPRESFERLAREKAEAEAAHEKRLLRLKEIFGHKSREFLEAVYSLLGWRIKFDESGADIRITSMYAPKGRMGLTIKFASQEGHFGTMQMSGAMARGLEEARHFWVTERQSIPGFLAQVTTEMFEKTTIGRAAGYVGLE